MATLDDLPRLLAEDAAAREDLISTLVAFCRRHGIEAEPEHFLGLAADNEDTAGHILQSSATLVPLKSSAQGIAGFGGGSFSLFFRSAPQTFEGGSGVGGR